MNHQSNPPMLATGCPPALVDPAKVFARPQSRPEMWVFAGLIAIFSGSVLFGSVWYAMMFQPVAVSGGEWWRLLTHPFVHITWYHLLLDASAFFLLYHSLLENKLMRRLWYVVASAFGSLALSWLAAPAIFTGGLCGLSGIAHGLMAISAAEMMRARPRGSTEWRIGAFVFVIVVSKAVFEAITGQILFGFLYFGMVGEPVTVSHAGGIVGGLLALLLMQLKHSAGSKGYSRQTVEIVTAMSYYLLVSRARRLFRSERIAVRNRQGRSCSDQTCSRFQLVVTPNVKAGALEPE